MNTVIVCGSRLVSCVLRYGSDLFYEMYLLHCACLDLLDGVFILGMTNVKVSKVPRL
jgi:hypothetical protein